jgi:hypothetical protein
MAGNNYIVTGVSAGTTNILIRDSAGATVNVSVSVVSAAVDTTAPPDVRIAIGSTQTYAWRRNWAYTGHQPAMLASLSFIEG